MDITWLFNGAHIQAYTGVSIVKGGKKASILTIDSVHAGHAGNYTCKARNDADSVEYSAELIVNGIQNWASTTCEISVLIFLIDFHIPSR